MPEPPARRRGIGETDPTLAVVTRTLLEEGLSHPCAGALERRARLRKKRRHLPFGPVLVQTTDDCLHLFRMPGFRGAKVLPVLLGVEVHTSAHLIRWQSVVHLELLDFVHGEEPSVAEVEGGAGGDHGAFGDKKRIVVRLERPLFLTERKKLGVDLHLRISDSPQHSTTFLVFSGGEAPNPIGHLRDLTTAHHLITHDRILSESVGHPTDPSDKLKRS